MTTPMPEISTFVLRNTNDTAGTMIQEGHSVYRPLPVGVATVMLSWAGGYDVEVMYNTRAATGGAYRVGDFSGVTESQTESLEIANDSSTGVFYVCSKNVVSGSGHKPLGLMITSWPI